MKTAALIFPHQLFENTDHLKNCDQVFLIEEYLFFKQYSFHKEKIRFHRSTMQYYKDHLEGLDFPLTYVNAYEALSDVRELVSYLNSQGFTDLRCIDPCDNWLEKRIHSSVSRFNFELETLESPLYLNSREKIDHYFKKDRKRAFHHDFYKQQRTTLDILMREDGQPLGGQWSFDADNRKKYPRNTTPPPIQYPDSDKYFEEATGYVDKYFSDNLGELSHFKRYPSNFDESLIWLNQFLKERFLHFGTYEDAMLKDHDILHHSVLTPMLNVGMLTPNQIVSRVLQFANEEDIPLNSVEGFVRQVIGWREFIRGVYVWKGSEERTKNFWGFSRKIPPSFYDGTTGIDPVDNVIKRVLKTGYCHHIERLMILGNFMLLCEFDPDEVYRWFMELFIDAYDWVMVPNVYGMSQFADGGMMSTKPYISGSNYVKKMSDYKKGEWEGIWNDLFWRFLWVHQEFFRKNPRMGMLLRRMEKMELKERDAQLARAESYLQRIS